MEKQSYLSKSRYLLLFLFALIVGSGSAWADDLTIYNDADYSYEYVPFYGYGADAVQHDQMIIPSTVLTTLDGKKITSMTFYYKTNESSGTNVGNWTVSLAETNATTLSALDTTTPLTQVYSGSITPNTTDKTITITFDNGYDYSGGNLLVDFNHPNASGYKRFTFWCVYVSPAPAYSSGAQRNYLPKTKFTYEDSSVSGPALAVFDGSTKINSNSSYDFGNGGMFATASATKTFTLKNAGTEAHTISVKSETGGFSPSLSNGGVLAAKSGNTDGSITLTLTMPAATASGVITLESSSDAIDDFVINVSGTIRDNNKIFVDFTNKDPKPEDWTLDTGWSVNGGGYATIGNSEASVRTSQIVSSGENLIIRYRGNNSYWSSWGASYYPSIKVYTATTGNGGGADWEQVGSTITGEDIGYNEWKTTSFTIPNTANYIAITGKYIDIDAIYGCQEPLNVKPKNLGYSNVTNSSAQLSWTSTASNFNIQYKATGDADWTTIENVTANPYTLTGLSAVTTYQVKVQADHGANGLSDYTDAISFTTKPNPVSSFPYTENFNSLSSDEIPAYWDNSEGTTTTASYKWVYYATGHEGKCVRFDSYNNNSGRTNFLKTRPFSFTEGQPMRLSFWYKNPTGGDFSVYASTDGGATYPTELATGLTGKSDWTEKVIDIPAAVYGNNVVIVFKGTSNYGSGDAYIYLDDVTISEKSNYAMSITGSDVSENTIAFGTVKNTTTTKTFTIKNDGGSALTHVSVVSSDAEVFTVSDTDFEIAKDGTKEITVTFVKGVEKDGGYSETIIVSQANIATPIELTVTGTYVAPTPATMNVTIAEAAVGETVAFGTVNKATTKTFKVSNTGESTLNATIGLSGANADKFTLSTTSLEVAGGANETFTVTFDSDDEDVAKTATVTLSAAGLDNVAFNVTGTYSNFWTEDFAAGTLPTGWVITPGSYSGDTYAWHIGTFSDYENKTSMAIAPTSTTYNTIITPRLAAKKDDVLNWDAYFNWSDEYMTVEWSNDGQTGWTTIYDQYKPTDESVSTRYYHKEMSFTAPADGNYYLRFTSRYSNGIDNFSGFKLNPKTHDASITAKSIPATGNQYVEYTATVTVNELLGKDDEVVTAELWIGTTKVATEADVTLNASTTKLISLSFTPATAMSGDATIKVYNGDESINLTSDVQAVTIAAATVLDEAVDPAITDGTLASVVVKYTPADGWNTIAMPFALTDDILTDIFGAGYKIYEFKSFSENKISFATATTFYAGYPYLVYVENAPAQEDIKLQGVSVVTAKADTYGGVTFQSSYAPIAAGDLTGNYGVTSAGEIRKAGSGASLNGFRAYFTDVPASARIFIDGEATGIGRITADGELQIKNVYNLNGQKVQNVKKGLYIVNGKKVVIK